MIRCEDSPKFQKYLVDFPLAKKEKHRKPGSQILKPMMRRVPVQEGPGLALAVARVTFSFSDLVERPLLNGLKRK